MPGFTIRLTGHAATAAIISCSFVFCYGCYYLYGAYMGESMFMTVSRFSRDMCNRLPPVLKRKSIECKKTTKPMESKPTEPK